VTRRNLLIGGGIVVVIALVVGGFFLFRSGKEEEVQTADSVPETTTTTSTTRVPNPTAPLTGLESESAEAAQRCAVSVKIGNTADAHPQHNVQSADVVYEEVVDGGITRLVAVYQSKGPDQVGSVRSVRPTDRYILWPLGGVFAYSGGNNYELASLKGVPVVALDETSAGELMFRGPGRAPNNLYANVGGMYERCESGAPAPLFTYRSPTAAVTGPSVSVVTVGFGRGYDTAWTWDATAGVWQRAIFGGPDVDPDGNQIVTQNIVVMQVRYVPDPTRNTVEADMVGEGPVQVFTAGRQINGTWSRPSIEKAAVLVSDTGEPIALTPGTTWVELMPQGNPVNTLPGATP
jgi:hypothetical protein